MRTEQLYEEWLSTMTTALAVLDASKAACRRSQRLRASARAGRTPRRHVRPSAASHRQFVCAVDDQQAAGLSGKLTIT